MQGFTCVFDSIDNNILKAAQDDDNIKCSKVKLLSTFSYVYLTYILVHRLTTRGGEIDQLVRAQGK